MLIPTVSFEAWLQSYYRCFARCECGTSSKLLEELKATYNTGSYAKDAAFFDAQQIKKKQLHPLTEEPYTSHNIEHGWVQGYAFQGGDLASRLVAAANWLQENEAKGLNPRLLTGERHLPNEEKKTMERVPYLALEWVSPKEQG